MSRSSYKKLFIDKKLKRPFLSSKLNPLSNVKTKRLSSKILFANKVSQPLGLFFNSSETNKIIAKKAKKAKKTLNNVPKKQVIKIYQRSSSISTKHLNKTVRIHCGKDFKRFIVTAGMLGFKYGEFSPTKKRPCFPKKRSKIKVKKYKL